MSTSRLLTLVKALAARVRSGGGREVADQLRRWLWSDATFYGLERDLDHPFDAPAAKLRLEIRPLRQDDLPRLLDDGADYASDRPWHIAAHRRSFARAGIGTCYVAVDEDGDPCYMQWLMLPGENEAVRLYFGGLFPKLAADEALLEHAFTREDYQGKGIMPAAMARIAERARPAGARRVITFVEERNIPALKGCERAGFRPYTTRVDHWRLLRRKVSFHPLPPGAPFPYEG